MFQEELGGNTAKKRQEDARRRRFQLKKDQEQKKKSKELLEVRISENTPDALVGDDTFEDAKPVIPVSIASLSVTGCVSSNIQSYSSFNVLPFQSLIRKYLSKNKSLLEQTTSFDRRMQDLRTIQSILLKNSSSIDVTTCEGLIRQCWYICYYHRGQRRPTRQNLARISSLLHLVVLPSLSNPTTNTSVPMLWKQQDTASKYRLLFLIQMCVFHLPISMKDFPRGNKTQANCNPLLMEQKGIVPNSIHNICLFFRTVLGISHIQQQQWWNAFAWSILFFSCTEEKSSDLISHARSLLMNHIGGNTPIPDQCDDPNKITSQEEKKYAGEVFTLLVDSVLYYDYSSSNGANANMLSCRLVTEIFTVPLLSYKLPFCDTMGHLLVTKSSSTPTSPILFILQSFYRYYLSEFHNATDLDEKVFTTPVDLKKCPCPSILSLFGNLVSWTITTTDFSASTPTATLQTSDITLLFSILTSLIPHIPLSIYQQQSSSGAAVAWIPNSTMKTQTTATKTIILLSETIVRQCQLLFLDDFVRHVFTICCQSPSDIISSPIYNDLKESAKSSQDLLWESNWIETTKLSTKSIAAQEATKKNSIFDAKKTKEAISFWKGKIQKFQKGITDVFSSSLQPEQRESNSNKPQTKRKGEGQLVNTSMVSRQLASGEDDASFQHLLYCAKVSATATGNHNSYKSNTTATKNSNIINNDNGRNDPIHCTNLLLASCRLYGSVLARWGGFGAAANSHSSTSATLKAEPMTISLLNVLCFSTRILKTLCTILSSNLDEDCHLKNDTIRNQLKFFTGDRLKMNEMPIRALKIFSSPCCTDDPTQKKQLSKRIEVENNDAAVLLMVFSCCLFHTLVVTDDADIYEADEPIPKLHLRRYINVMRKLLFRACWLDEIFPTMSRQQRPHDWNSNFFGISVISAAVRIMKDLYDRSSRRPICAPDLWVVEDLLDKELARCKGHEDYIALLHTPLLRRCPFLVPFKRRLKLFDRLVTTDRVLKQGSNETQNLKPGLHVRILRGRVLEDGIAHLNSLGKNLRQRIVVSYYNQAGTIETGLDVGGLFKEFWTDLSALAFDPNYALFRITEGGDNCLYPNPSSEKAHGDDHLLLFGFLGRILGKALYEGITINPQFAHFFLAFLRGDYNFLHMLPDLRTMDSQLYQNLMFLKTYNGDASDMSLTFTILTDDFGSSEEKALIPNGANVEVTNNNKQRYIGLVAKYYVCDRIRLQSEAFTRGLWEVIDSSWLRLFDPNELQVLISGSSEGKLDISDLRAHTRYVAGYTVLDVNIIRFWSVVSKMPSKSQRDLLRFVTSCERPPPLGFGSMNPPFTIQRISIANDDDKLPSASTCFNTLKLPTYSSEKVLREKLVYAIESGSGFELT